MAGDLVVRGDPQSCPSPVANFLPDPMPNCAISMVWLRSAFARWISSSVSTTYSSGWYS